MNNKIKKVGLMIGTFLIAGTAFVSAQSLSPSEFAVRQQMINFAKFWPHLVSQYYPAMAQPVEEDRSGILGSVTGPDLYSPYQGVNDVKTYTIRQRMLAATTTPCSIKAPTASTTLMWWGYQIYSGTSTAATAVLATSTTPYATTTALTANWGISASAPDMGMYISSTTAASLRSRIFRGVEYLNLGLSGAAGSGTTNGFTYGGYCSAQFISI